MNEPRDGVVATPIANVEAEQSLLGALLYDNDAMERLGDRLKPEHFYEPLHGRLFAWVEAAIRAGRVADIKLAIPIFAEDEAFAELGGAAYLGDLVDRAPPGVRVPSYADSIYDLALRRALVRLSGDTAQAAISDHEVSAEQQIEAAEQALYVMAQQGQSQTGFRGMDHFADRALQMAADAYSNTGALIGLSTGLKGLDEKLGGLCDTDLIILAARPAMGKSAMAVNIAKAVAKAGVPVGLFSLEMSGEQLALRLLSDLAGVSGEKVRRGEIDANEFSRLRDAREIADALPIHTDDTGALDIGRLVTRARRLKRTKGIGLVIVDYLQLVVGSSKRRDGNRVQEVSEVTMALKALAKDLGVPVLALSQLSRQVETRENKRPQLSDLRESGSIEQDADVVMFIYREVEYLRREEPEKGTAEHLAWSEKHDQVANAAEVIIGKQRHGRTGLVNLHFDGELTKFSDPVKADHLPVRMHYQ